MKAAQRVALLCADDEPDFLEQLIEDLEAELGDSVDVFGANDGAELFDLASEVRKTHEIGLYILDQIMPRMTGVQAFNILSQQSVKPNAILFSGRVDREASGAKILQKAENLGILYFVSKPDYVQDKEALLGPVHTALATYAYGLSAHLALDHRSCPFQLSFNQATEEVEHGRRSSGENWITFCSGSKIFKGERHCPSIDPSGTYTFDSKHGSVSRCNYNPAQSELPALAKVTLERQLTEYNGLMRRSKEK